MVSTAKTNPSTFFAIASKLIPANVELTIKRRPPSVPQPLILGLLGALSQLSGQFARDREAKRHLP